MPENTISPPLTMTPGLERILARGRSIHPSMPDDFNGDMPVYNENMDLPALDDKQGILWWMGLNDNIVDWALKRYQEKFASDPEQLAVKMTKTRGTQHLEGYLFPLADRLREIVMKGETELLLDLEENYDGLVQGGLLEGLRPEFAIFCGLHPSEDDYKREDYRENYYIQSYQEQADNIMQTWLIPNLRDSMAAEA